MDMINVQQNLSTPLIALHCSDGVTALDWSVAGFDLATLRSKEKYSVSLEDVAEGSTYVAIYSLRQNEAIQAGLSVGTTLLVCIVLGSGAMLFSRITTDLVISPIEDMVQRVHSITDDPLKAAHQEEERLLIREMARKDLDIEVPDDGEVAKFQ